MWWAVAAAALPYVMSAFQDKPKEPGAPSYAPLPDRSKYIESILNDAYNPNSETYNLASERAVDQVNRILGRTGMSGSTVGAQAHSMTQAELANKWLENVAARKNQAMQTVNAYDAARGNHDMGVANSAYDYEMRKYDRANERNANQIQGISNMVNMGMGAYYQDQAQQRYDKQYAQNQAMIDAMTRRPSYSATPSYGVPGQSYQMPASNDRFYGGYG